MGDARCINCMKKIEEGIACPHCGALQQADVNYPYALRPNTILHGKYLIGRVLGQGGFGITYVGFDLALEIKVAVKEYFPQGLAGRGTSSGRLVWNKSQLEEGQAEQGVKAFLKEARQMAKLDRLPGVVRVRDVFPDNETAYIVMDFVEGETLKSRLRRCGAMSFAACVQFFDPLFDSLEHMHAQNLIHRDISPDNIMIRPDGSLCLLDLGAAKDLTGNSSLSSQLVMKRGFSPMEQCTSGGNIGPWTDVYALTATIYYSITGKLVPNVMDRAYSEQFGGGSAKLEFVSASGEPLPAAVCSVLRAGLEIRVDRRISTIGELKTALFDACRGISYGESDTGGGENTGGSGSTGSIVGGGNFEGGSIVGSDIGETVNKEESGSQQWLLALQRLLATLQEIQKKQESLPKKDSPETCNTKDQEDSSNTEDSKYTYAASDTTDAADLADTADKKNTTAEGPAVKSAELKEAQKEQSGKSKKKTRLIAIAAVAAASVIGIAAASGRSGAGSTVSDEKSGGDETTASDFGDDGDEAIASGAEEGGGGIVTHASGNAMMADAYGSYDGADYALGSKYERTEILTITFLDSIEGNRTAWDVSAAGDGSVMAWVEKNGSGYDLYIGGEGGVDLTDGYQLFEYYIYVEEINFNSCVYTGDLTNMNNMFAGCKNLLSLDLSSFDTSNVTDMGSMFADCVDLTSLDLSGFDTSNVTNMALMFECNSLTSLDLSSFDTSNVTKMNMMFDLCSSLTNLDLSNFDTSSVTGMAFMFSGCDSLTSLDLSSFDTSSVTDMAYMFHGCDNLESLNLSSFDTSNVTDMSYMFDECGSLTNLDLSNFDISHAVATDGMFDECGISAEQASLN